MNGSKRVEYGLALALFLILTAIFTWPLVLRAHEGTLGGRSDTLLNTWIMSWNAHTLFSDPCSLFQGNIIYPSRDVLTYSEVMLVESLLAAPFYRATRNPILAHNLVLILGSVLASFGCYLLVKELTGSRWGGIAGGIFFALCPYKISKIGHLQIFFSPFMPFMVLYLYKYLERGERKHLVLFGAFYLLQGLSSWYYLVFCSISAGLLWLWYALSARNREQWVRLGLVIIAMLVAAAALLPLAIPYLRAHARLPSFERTLDESLFYSARPGDFLNVLPENILYGKAPAPFRKGQILSEKVLYPGLLVVVLALAGLFARRRKAETGCPFNEGGARMKGYFALLIMVNLILMFGPEIAGVPNPLYAPLYHLGLFKFTRMPSRFFVNVVLGLSVLCGYGIAKISRVVKERKKSLAMGRAAAGALVVLLVLEMLTFNLTVYAVPVWGEVPEVYRWLGEQGDDIKIIELPTLPLDNACTDFRRLPLNPVDMASYLFREGMLMYLSTYHWKRTVNGYSGYLPFFYRRIMSEMQGFPSRRTVDLLGALDIDYVIWHWNWVEAEKADLMRERLKGVEGLRHFRDFERLSVYAVEKSPTAGGGDLRVSLLAPRATVEQAPFNAGLLVRNESDRVFISTDEGQQACAITFEDESGIPAFTLKARCPAPFFLEPGEETVLPIKVDSAPPPGTYTLTVKVMEGPLKSNIYGAELTTLPPEEAAGSGGMAGSVSVEPHRIVMMPVPDGLFPLQLYVGNQGDVLWRALWEEKDTASSLSFGFVSLIVRWGHDGTVVWKDEEYVLPCDLYPGDKVKVPILVRPPDTPGRYHLFAGLYDRDVGWFGEPLIVEVEIEGTGELP